MKDIDGIRLIPYTDFLEIRVINNGRTTQIQPIEWAYLEKMRNEAIESAPFVVLQEPKREEKARGDG